MSYLGLLKMTATVVRENLDATDDYNNPAPGTAVEVDYEAHLEQDRPGGSELTDDRDTQESGFTLFLPADAVVRGDDRVRVEGVEYDVIGPASIIRNPRLGNVHHVEVRLRRIDREVGS